MLVPALGWWWNLQMKKLKLTSDSIWLIDVNRQLPSAGLDGFDISPDQFPPKQWLPTAISLETLNIHEPVAEHLEGRYDLIHVRLFLAVVKNNDPTPILSKLMAMLSKYCLCTLMDQQGHYDMNSC